MIRLDTGSIGAMREEWRPILGYEGLYEVSNLGRVRSLHARFAEPRPCKFGTDQTGYPTVMLSKEGRRKPFTVHRLVAVAFHGSLRNALHREVGHLDGDMKNCRADNLKWVSKTENEAHKYAHGTNSSERFSKLTKPQVAFIKSQRGIKSHAAIARELGVVKADAVSKIARGERWNIPAAAIARNVRSRDLGDGPHRPFGSALVGGAGGHVERCPRIGPTARLQSEPPCSVCGNRSAWRCLCECEEEQ